MTRRVRDVLQLVALLLGAILGAWTGIDGVGVLLGVLVVLELERRPLTLEDRRADELELRELRSTIQAERFRRGELVVLELEGGLYWIGPAELAAGMHKHPGTAGLGEHNSYYTELAATRFAPDFSAFDRGLSGARARGAPRPDGSPVKNAFSCATAFRGSRRPADA